MNNDVGVVIFRTNKLEHGVHTFTNMQAVMQAGINPDHTGFDVFAILNNILYRFNLAVLIVVPYNHQPLLQLLDATNRIVVDCLANAGGIAADHEDANVELCMVKDQGSQRQLDLMTYGQFLENEVNKVRKGRVTVLLHIQTPNMEDLPYMPEDEFYQMKNLINESPIAYVKPSIEGFLNVWGPADAFTKTILNKQHKEQLQLDRAAGLSTATYNLAERVTDESIRYTLEERLSPWRYSKEVVEKPSLPNAKWKLLSLVIAWTTDALAFKEQKAEIEMSLLMMSPYLCGSKSREPAPYPMWSPGTFGVNGLSNGSPLLSPLSPSVLTVSLLNQLYKIGALNSF